jgi:hypothetical protein
MHWSLEPPTATGKLARTLKRSELLNNFCQLMSQVQKSWNLFENCRIPFVIKRWICIHMMLLHNTEQHYVRVPKRKVFKT